MINMFLLIRLRITFVYLSIESENYAQNIGIDLY